MVKPSEVLSEILCKQGGTVEWALCEAGRCVKGPFPTQEEAEAYRVALEMTRHRADAEHFVETGGIALRSPLVVAWREVTQWSSESREQP